MGEAQKKTNSWSQDGRTKNNKGKGELKEFSKGSKGLGWRNITILGMDEK